MKWSVPKKLCGLRSAAALFSDRSGAAVVVIAFALTGVLGVAGLATEASSWYFTGRRMQSAADAAAYTAAISLAANEIQTDFTNEAKYVAANTGYNFSTSTGATVTVNNPPSTGSHTSDANAVEVIITQSPTALLSSLFMATGPTIKARAVATKNVNNNGCVLALDRGNVVDTTDSGGGTINLTNCSMFINSNDPSGALTMNGSTTINTSGAFITGGISTNGGATLNSGGNTHTGVAPINDPYADISVPSYNSSCSPALTNYSLGNNQSDTQGTAGGTTVFCGGLKLTGSANLTLASGGTYIIDGGALDLSGQSTLSGTNVTIILTGSGSNYATVKIAGGATVNLTAPTTGTYAGLAIFQDRNAPSGVTNSMEGGANQSITGAIYFPTESLKFAGNSSGSATCTQLVVQQLTFTGSTSIGSNCSGVAVDHFGNATATLVE